MRPARHRNAGVALLLALLVVTVLAVTVFPFLYDGRVERAVASNLYTGLQASRLATSGVVFAEALLKADAQDQEGRRFDAYSETWAQFNDLPVAAGGGSIAMRIVDESAKLNVNRLVVAQTGKVDDAWSDIVVHLLMLREQDESTARALVETLIDWIDPDERPTGFNGAEKSYYLGLTPPDEPADRPLLTIGELRRIKGWEPKVVEAVAPYLTTQPIARVNVNTAPVVVLRALGLDEGPAASLVDRREKPLLNINDLRDATGLSGPGLENLQKYVDFKSTHFSVTATATFRDSVAVVRAVLQREGPRVQRVYWRAE